MTYTIYDQSADKGSPYELYAFLCSTGDYFYTDNGEQVSYGGDEYLPLQITRGTLEFNTVTDSPVTTQITVPTTCQLFFDHERGLVHPDMSVEVRRFHRGTTGSRLRSVGRVVTHSVAGERYTLEIANTVQTEVQRTTAPVVYDTKCNHVLGDARCKVNRAAFSKTTMVADAGDYVVMVSDDGYSNGALRGGEIVINGENRTIVDNVDNAISIAYPFVEAKPGDPVTLYRDCNQMFDKCRDVFGNTLNFGGFPLLPTENPALPDLVVANQMERLQYVLNYRYSMWGGVNGNYEKEVVVKTPISTVRK